MNRWLFLWRQLNRKLWVRASLYAVLGVAVAVAAVIAAPFVPESFAKRFGGGSVEAVLSILASSMLAVTIFSLGAMVTAYTAVSQAASPRVSELVTGDADTQRALATFVGSFLYAVVGVTAINAGYYGAEGRAVIFVFSLGLVALVAFRLLAWVNRLSQLARVGHMIEQVEGLVMGAFRYDRRASPPPVPEGFGGRDSVACETTGYVRNVDYADLESAAAEFDFVIAVLARPGKALRRGEPLCSVSMPLDETARERLGRAFAVGPTRSFDQDPRFGLVVLGEIAGKALSPAVNDPGTAIQVIMTGVRLLDGWATESDGQAREAHRPVRVFTLPLDPADLLDDVFGPVMRHGSSDFAVSVRLQKALAALAALGGGLGVQARVMGEQARGRALAAAASAEDREKIAAAALDARRHAGAEPRPPKA